ncbi:MAG: hypothetical protein JOZ77_13300 [Candidatus Eremiobacteraeota bacterium]|nr:hypothetical protein [Candidatus Eremiobacteraeota bacterium]
MSPTQRPSTIDGLRRGMAQAPAADNQPRPAADIPTPARTKPVRVTLNFPPELFRQLDHWTREAADSTGLPRVGVQDAVRAMVRVITNGQARNAESQVLSELKRH